MQAVAEIIAAFVTAIAAAAFAQFGVILDPPEHASQAPEVHRTVTSAPAARSEPVSALQSTDCPEHRVKTA